MVAPVATENRPLTLPIFRGPFVRPGMNVENARSLCATIAEKLMRPPAFKISAAPNCDVLYVRKFQRAIHPSAAAPLRRAHIPIRMIVE